MSQAYQPPIALKPTTPPHTTVVRPRSRLAISRIARNASPRLLVPQTAKSFYFQPERSALEFSPPTIGQPATNQPATNQPATNQPASPSSPETAIIVPRSGIQLYAQRLNALRAGRLYTRLPANSFYAEWRQAAGHPSYDQWRQLLALEARAAARGKGHRNLAVMVGDSLSQWFPVDRLPNQQLWLNQGISGDTTSGILKRLSLFSAANAETIYLMAGVNDLKRGASDREILRNINQIIQRLKQQNPDAQIVVQSILPTRSRQIPNARIAQLNSLIDIVAQRQGVNYLDLHPQFSDRAGYMRPEFTTDGIHLSPQGYEQWQMALQRMDQQLAQRPRTIAQAQTLRARLKAES
jgi:lysophospholipase L1-like esterase